MSDHGNTWGATLPKPKKKSGGKKNKPHNSPDFQAAVNQAVTQALATQPDYGGRKGIFFGAQAPRQIHQRGERPWTLSKAIGLFRGIYKKDQANEEYQLSEKLKQLYSYAGIGHDPDSVLLPLSSSLIPRDTQQNERLAEEIRQKTTSGYTDPDEIAWLRRKAMGTLSDVAGGSFVEAPMIAEILDLQRAAEVWTTAGATQLTFPQNGRIALPKLAGGVTGYWVGEGKEITSSDATTGSMDLYAKKAAVLMKINNEMIRYASSGTDELFRKEMAARLALLIDKANFDGAGTSYTPKGLLKYSSQANWQTDHNKWVLYESAGAATNGDVWQPEDILRMYGKLPDEVLANQVKIITTRELLVSVATRRGDAITAGDGQGVFVQQQIFGNRNEFQAMLNGFPVFSSSQVPKDRSKGSASDLSLAIMGNFAHWGIARLGVLELTKSDLGDTPLVYDQTWIRALQFVDCGPLHTPSFVVCDKLVNS